MKKIIVCAFFSLLFHAILIAQNPYFIGCKIAVERNWLTNTGFDNLNYVLSNNDIPTLRNVHNTGGYTLLVGRKNKKMGFELTSGGFTAKTLSRDTTPKDVVQPSVTGRYFRVMVTAKLYENQQWRVIVGGGISANNAEFTLADLRPQINSLNNLIITPSLSPSLIYSSNNITKFEACVEGNYITKLIKEGTGEFAVGFRVGYAYQFERKIDKIRWFVKETRNEIERFPLLIMDNLFVQLNVSVSFNLASYDKK